MNINTFLSVSNIGKSRIVIGDFPERAEHKSVNVSSVREKRTDTGSQRLDDRNITDTWTSLMKPHQVKSEPQNRRISNVEGWVRSPRRRRYNPYEPEASLSHFL